MKVLLTLDESSAADGVISSAINRSWPKNSHFRVIAIFEPICTYYMYSPAIFSPSACDAIANAEKEMLAHKEKQVQDAIDLLKKNIVAATITGEVISGPVKETILDEAKRWDADLIVCGTHGRHGVEKFLLGSVAQSVAEHATCSVEIVKPKSASKSAA